MSIGIDGPVEELVGAHWGLRGPFLVRMVRDEPFRRTWWILSRNGSFMAKWFGEPPERREWVYSALRLTRWASEQGAPVTQLWALRDGSCALDVGDGILAVFEYVDGSVGVRNFGALGRAVARVHMLPMPEFAERSSFAPRLALPEAHRQLTQWLDATRASDDLAGHARESLNLLRELPLFLELPIGIIHTNLGIAHTFTRTTGEIAFLDTVTIGIGPIALDFPAVLCEHLATLDTAGHPTALDVNAAREFFAEYEHPRPIPKEERDALLVLTRMYAIIRAARALDQARATGSHEFLSRARGYFGWLAYADRAVPELVASVLCG